MCSDTKIGKVELFSIAFGSIIGWGAFILPGNVFLPKFGVLNTLIGFAVAVVMLFFIENSYFRVFKAMPKSIGEYGFATNILGRNLGFFTGWSLLLSYLSIIPLNATAVPMVLDAVFPFYSRGFLLYNIADYPVYLNDILISLSVIVFFIFLNLRSMFSSFKLQNISVFLLIVSLIIILLIGFIKIGNEQKINFDSNFGEVNVDLIVRVIAFAPWAFIGFDTVAQMSRDHNLDSKSVSFITLLAISFGAIIYNLLNIITAYGINNNNILNSSWATGAAVRELVGDIIFYFLAVSMLGAVLSGLNAFFISSTRLIVSIGEDYSNMIFKDSNENILIPRKIVLFVGASSLLVPFFGRTALSWFVDLASVGASFAYLVTCLCAFKISETFFKKLISVIGVLISISFLLFLLTPFFDSNVEFPSYIILLFWIFLGIFLFQILKKGIE